MEWAKKLTCLSVGSGEEAVKQTYRREKKEERSGMIWCMIRS
jgi:hypothetical protein